MTGAVYGKEKVNHTSILLLLTESLIQSLVAVLGRAPNLVFDAAMNVVLGVGLDDKEPTREENKLSAVSYGNPT